MSRDSLTFTRTCEALNKPNVRNCSVLHPQSSHDKTLVMRRMSPFSIGLLALLTSTICSCEAGQGARVAEDPSGAWLTVCSVEVEGPERAARTLAGTAKHIKESKAMALATLNACKKSTHSDECVNNSSQWPRQKHSCTAKTNEVDKKPKKQLFECHISIEQPAYTPSATKQSEGKEQDTACRRARVNACRSLSAGVPCTRGQKGWTHRTSIGRRRSQTADPR